MTMMTLHQALGFIQQQLPQARLVGDGAVALLRVHSDSRSLQSGDLFVALRGERFDGNEFLSQAQAAGAAAALCSVDPGSVGLPGIVVPNPLQGLGALATGWRQQFDLPLIAVTGSNGKTTVTQMIAAILRASAGDAAFATRGNLNNDIGVPLTLLGLQAAHRLAVVELGMNHPGEIATLAAMARPTVALVNNAQREHQEFMHTVEAVARENGSVLASLPAEGVAVFPAGDAYTRLWHDLAGERQVVLFGEQADGAQVFASAVAWEGGAWSLNLHTPAGHAAVRLQIAGRHNVRNALAAAACAHAAGVPLAAIAEGLTAFEPVKGRSRALALQVAGRGVTVVDDTYNANPDSVAAAIEVLRELPAPQLLVLGDMGEVGDQGPQFHAEAGTCAQQKGIPQIFTLGEQSAFAAAAFGVAARHFDSMAALQAAVCAAMPGLGSVLVKGSRFMKMEQVVQAMQAGADQGATACGETAC